MPADTTASRHTQADRHRHGFVRVEQQRRQGSTGTELVSATAPLLAHRVKHS